MHISEGVLSPAVLGGGAALTVVGTAIGLKKLDYEAIPRVAILSAAFFVASLIHVPVGPVGLHLVLNGLMGLLLGWLATAMLLSGLLVAAALVFTGQAFLEVAELAVLAHLPVMVIEGLITMFVFLFLKKVRPEMLEEIYG
jgi:ABC-type Co2+ transport system permease subunit